jgi:ferredoxin
MVRQALRSFTYRHAAIDQAACKRCGECAENCPSHAIGLGENGRYTVDRAECISCYCCAEVCPHDAISVREPWARRLLDRVRSPFG